MTNQSCGRRRAGFTLLELMAVIAILAVLAAILIPSISAARTAANRSRTKVQFAQWALACAQFKQEYGYFPALGTENRIATADDSAAFVRILTGRNADGSPVTASAQLGGNTRRIAFLTLASTDFVDGYLVDSFGNREFGVIWDIDGDGFVKPGVDGVAPAVTSALTGRTFSPEAGDLPPAGVRAEVLLYSAGRGNDAHDLILSWK